jgi:hypothetical protein
MDPEVSAEGLEFDAGRDAHLLARVERCLIEAVKPERVCAEGAEAMNELYG